MNIDIVVDPPDVEAGNDPNSATLILPDYAKMSGIFKLEKHPSDDSKDQLVWCYSIPGKARPTNFDVAPGSDHKLVVLERFRVEGEQKAIETIKANDGSVFMRRGGGTGEWSGGYQAGAAWAHTVILRKSSKRSPDVIAALHDLQRLTKLGLGYIDEDVVKSLAGHRTLKQLRFECEITPKILDQLVTGLPGLEQLEIVCPKFSAEFGKSLSKWKSLRSLIVRNNKDGFKGLKQLEESAIDTLEIRTSQFALSNFELFGSSSNIRKLKFHSTTLMSSDDLKPVSVQQLEEITMLSCQIDEKGTKYLMSFSDLKFLEINRKTLLGIKPKADSQRKLGGKF